MQICSRAISTFTTPILFRRTMPTQTSRKVTKSVFAIEQKEGAGAVVRRSIGSPALRNLTPFLMLDHFIIRKGAGFPDHPHRGQSTVTYMLEGKVQHEDFAGHTGTIGPGDLQWMVAGKGIMHAEMPLHEEGRPDPQGLQLWIDLPAKDKGIEPLYQEMSSSEITTVRPSPDVEISVISGESHGEKGVVRPVGGCWYLDFKLKSKGAKVFQPLPKGWTSFIYLLSGALTVGGQSEVQNAFHTLVLSADDGEDGVWLEAAEDGLTRGVLIAGEPLKQHVVQYGPFVTTSVDEARQAVMDFQNAQNGFERAKHWRSEIGKPLTNRMVR
ncbi:hypothetical protein NliqN6_0096 [Naganishia liquefaciens]|uniref:Pirin family protein n=1 Tax=Naganishia liquefaciens TaxID=104408 RepID=A0A8H3YBW4_9TREE|nr:hypothetical protein NliqN6_0096 [Naganishia liquefaciens]